MTADIRALHRRLFEEGMNQRKEEVFAEVLADDYVNHDWPAPAPGREGFVQVTAMFFAAFPDLHVDVQEVVAEGDTLGARGVFTGTHRGEFMGIPATGRRATVTYSDIWKLRDGRLAENWVQMDMLGLMQQLGAVPSPEAAVTA